MTLEERIMEHEGFIPKIYKDTRGLATIGYGHLVKPTDIFKEEVEYPEEELYELFLKDLQEAKEGAHTLVGHIKDLHPNAWECVVEMIYQLGTTGVMKFAKMLLALEEKNYHEAHLQMLDSLWRKQTQKRCEVLSSIMKECT
jgi:GH24 family phage-related lysozyme (muramidase)